MFTIREVAQALDVKPDLLKCIFKVDHAYYGIAKGTKIRGKNYLDLDEVIKVAEFFTRKKIIEEMRDGIEILRSRSRDNWARPMAERDIDPVCNSHRRESK